MHVLILTTILFQFTPLREGRLTDSCFCFWLDDISIHAPPRGATLLKIATLPHAYNFNSRPSARGDVVERGIVSHQIISIHAPPRGATLVRKAQAPEYERISIHAPPRGATAPPRKRVATKRISIHAPPRGATGSWAVKEGLQSYFNSRPSARGD